MFAALCRRRLRLLPQASTFAAQQFPPHQITVFVKSFYSQKLPPTVCENDPQNIFTVSYLINSCGLSSEEAISISNKLRFKSADRPDAVLDLFRKYDFTNADISLLVSKLPNILFACPDKVLLPKIEFFRSIGVPVPVLAHKLSVYPFVLRRSLENSIIPAYNALKSLLKCDKKVVQVFTRAPRAFVESHNVAILRERGVPESSIASLVVYQPALLVVGKEKLAASVDRAVALGFDISKSFFIHAIRVFLDSTESTLRHKMDVYRRCGWSESDISTAFSRHPFCLQMSEKKIIAIMDFLVREFGYEPEAVAEHAVLLTYSLDKRIKPRCLVARILNEKGLKKMGSLTSMVIMSEEKFVKKYIVDYQKDVPELLDIYQGKLSPTEISLSQEVLSK